jgi:hypothetical protein
VEQSSACSPSLKKCSAFSVTPSCLTVFTRACSWISQMNPAYTSRILLEALTAVVMKSFVFWCIMSCSPLTVNRHFGETCRFNLQGRRISYVRNQSEAGTKHIIIIVSGVGPSPLGTTATSGLLYKPQMIDEGDCGAIGGMKIGRGNRNTRRKPAPAPLCPPQIPGTKHN